MIALVRRWLGLKWSDPTEKEIVDLTREYSACFNTYSGQRVVKHLMDNIYCTVCTSNDPVVLATHNGRRSVVNEILENIDLGDRAQEIKDDRKQEVPHGS